MAAELRPCWLRPVSWSRRPSSLWGQSGPSPHYELELHLPLHTAGRFGLQQNRRLQGPAESGNPLSCPEATAEIRCCLS